MSKKRKGEAGAGTSRRVIGGDLFGVAQVADRSATGTRTGRDFRRLAFLLRYRPARPGSPEPSVLGGVICLAASLSGHHREHFADHGDGSRSDQHHENAWKDENHEWKDQLDRRLGGLFLGQLTPAVRIESLCTRSAWAMLEPNLSA